jgi:ubiquinone/menaquinone biosynthesis C-methylase UbiE
VTKLSVSNGYAKWAASYDESVNPLIRLERECLARILPSLRYASVLDAATGTGRHAIAFARQGASVVGVDASRAMLDVAEKKRKDLGLSNLSFLEAAIGPDWALAAPSFDLVICALALCHVSPLKVAVASLVRTLHSRGTLIITDLHPAAVSAGLGTLFSQDNVQYSIETVAHTVDEYLDAVRSAGASIVETHELPLGDAVSSPAGLPPHVAKGNWRQLPFCLVITAERGEDDAAKAMSLGKPTG